MVWSWSLQMKTDETLGISGLWLPVQGTMVTFWHQRARFMPDTLDRLFRCAYRSVWSWLRLHASFFVVDVFMLQSGGIWTYPGSEKQWEKASAYQQLCKQLLINSLITHTWLSQPWDNSGQHSVNLTYCNLWYDAMSAREKEKGERRETAKWWRALCGLSDG